MTSWLPTYWTSYFNVSVVTAGILTAAYSLSASIFRVFGGSISDRIGGGLTAKAALFAMLAGALLLTFSHGSPLSLVATLVMALGMGVANAAVFKLVTKEIPQAVSGASGWVGGLGAFGGFALPPILSYFVRVQGQPGYPLGFLTYIVLTALSIVFVFILTRARSS